MSTDVEDGAVDPKDPTSDMLAACNKMVTTVKLAGASSAMMTGNTTPEGWPFVIVVAIAKPGNERALEYTKELAEKIAAETTWRRAII